LLDFPPDTYVRLREHLPLFCHPFLFIVAASSPHPYFFSLFPVLCDICLRCAVNCSLLLVYLSYHERQRQIRPLPGYPRPRPPARTKTWSALFSPAVVRPRCRLFFSEPGEVRFLDDLPAGGKKVGNRRKISATQARYRRVRNATQAGHKRDTSAKSTRQHRAYSPLYNIFLFYFNKLSMVKIIPPTSLAFPGCHFLARREKSGKKRKISAKSPRQQRDKSATKAGRQREISGKSAPKTSRKS
jgi:hypothetical protein